MEFEGYQGRMEDVAVSIIPGKISNSVCILEIGKGVNARSRISLVDKDTGKNHTSGTMGWGYVSEKDIEGCEAYLRLSIDNRMEYLKNRHSVSRRF
jgi:hypothetical protein